MPKNKTTNKPISYKLNRNPNQNHNEISHLLEWLLSKRLETNMGGDAEKKETSGTVGGNVNWHSH